MFIAANPEPSALRQEGNVYSRQTPSHPPSVRRATFIAAKPRAPRSPSGGQCL